MIARGFVAGIVHGKVSAPIDGRSVFAAFAQIAVELVFALGQIADRLEIAFGIAEFQRYNGVTFIDQTVLDRFGCPAQADTGTDRVHAGFFDLVDQGYDFVRCLDPEITAEGKHQFIVIRDTDRLIFMTFVEFAPVHANMDAANRAACAGHFADQVLAGKFLTGNVIGMLIRRRLEVIGWQRVGHTE